MTNEGGPSEWQIVTFAQSLKEQHPSLSGEDAVAIAERWAKEVHFFGEFRRTIRAALWPYWRSNLGVSDSEIVTAVSNAARLAAREEEA